MKIKATKSMKRLTTLSLTIAVAALLWLALSAGGSAQAQTPDTPTPAPTAEQSDAERDRDAILANIASKPKYPKMDSNLNRIVEQVESGQFTAQAAAAGAPLHSEQSVAVTLYITEGYAQSVWDFLEANGGDPRNIGIDYIEAYLPVSLLPAASQREGVISIRTIIPAQPAQGAVVSGGAAAHGVPTWHTAGLKGEGVKIGVIDSGFRGFQSLMGTELPASVVAICYTDIGVFTSRLSDCDNADAGQHGTAVSEALFDIAPEATYYIARAATKGDLSNAVDWLVSQDVDVINQSLSYTWDGPGDGTSPFSFSPLMSVDTAVDADITWVNVAGNDARRTWFGGVQKGILGFFQDFEGTNYRNHVNLRAGQRFSAQLRWGDKWGGATKNLNMSLTKEGEGEIVASGVDFQTGDAEDDPFEFLTYTPSTDGTYYLTVNYIFTYSLMTARLTPSGFNSKHGELTWSTTP